MRLEKLRKKSGGAFDIRWQPFALRPEPDPAAAFKGTYRENAWKRAAELLDAESIRVRMWERPDFPDCSLPALQAGLCAAEQGSAVWSDLHRRLYEAFFVRGINIAKREEVITVAREAALDFERFVAAYDAPDRERETLAACTRTVSDFQVRAVPTLVFPAGRLVGASPEEQYRRALEASGVRF